MNIIKYSLVAKLETCKHFYIQANISNVDALINEMLHDIKQGNEIPLTKIVGKDVVNLLKLITWQTNTHQL
jgi:hypothetical protein